MLINIVIIIKTIIDAALNACTMVGDTLAA